ncbi:MAG TPA: hypothetical protein VLD59_04255 [Steroidobacteraceae bacterium]|nr:hypothetical protein [Steroidobacteraceae bacterium]
MIPSVVHDKKGVPMYVNKDGSLMGQKQQYNLYLLVRLMLGISDMRSMPPMTAPHFGLDIPPERVLTEGTVDDLIEQNAFAMYEARRAGEPVVGPRNPD